MSKSDGDLPMLEPFENITTWYFGGSTLLDEAQRLPQVTLP